MKFKTIILASAFVFVLVLYSLITYWSYEAKNFSWASFEEDKSFFSVYLENKDYLVGYSYALAATFTLFAIFKLMEKRRKSVLGVSAGFSWIALLYVGGCFLLGCCGSPLLPVYLSLFGASFLKFNKFVLAGLTTISVGVGYIWLKRKDICCEECGKDPGATLSGSQNT